MMDIAAVLRLLDQLRESDVSNEVFGAESHKYRLNPPLSEQELVDFEEQHTVSLPVEYRDFLRCAGNGGAGPFYGLFPLGEFYDYDAGCISQLFSHADRWNADENWFKEIRRLTKAEQERAKRPLKELLAEPPSDENPTKQRLKMQSWYYDGQHVNGAVPIAHEGCAYFDLLVVTGPASGTIWIDGRTSDQGIAPLLRSDGTPHSFLSWYTDWLRNSLQEIKTNGSIGRLTNG